MRLPFLVEKLHLRCFQLLIVLGYFSICTFKSFSQTVIPPQLEFVLNTRGDGLTDFNHWEVYVKDGQGTSLTGHLDIPMRYAGFDQFKEYKDLPVTVIANLSSDISSVTIPNSIKRIEDNAFVYCQQLKSIVIPNSVNYVGTFAFKFCSSLKSVVISPNNQCTSSFSGCDIFKAAYPSGKRCLVATIEVSYPDDCIPNEDGWIYNSSKSALYFVPYDATSIIIPSSVITIGTKALAGCTKAQQIILKSITPPLLYDDSLDDTDIRSIVVPAGCKESYVQDSKWAKYANIITEAQPPLLSLDMTSLSLYTQENKQLTANIVNPESEWDLKWVSDNEEVATVDESGLVKAISTGSAVITAEYGTLSATCEVKVYPVPVAGVELNFSNLDIRVSQKQQLVASILPQSASDATVKWSSEDSTIAMVDENGLVTGISVGQTTIVAECENFIAKCSVNVVITEPERIILTHSYIKITPESTYQLNATVRPDTTTDKTVSWSSTNEDIASVDNNGLITAQSLGTCNILANCGSVIAKCEVEVVSQTPQSLALDKSTLTIVGFDEQQLIATVNPETTTFSILWSSSNEKVATVDKNGLITSHSSGKANITAEVGLLRATCEVTVIDVEPSHIAVNPEELKIIVGNTAKITAEVFPKNAFYKYIGWESWDSSIATVDQNGVVTAVSVGETDINVACDGCGKFIKVIVIPVPVNATEVNLDTNAIELEVDEKYKLSATVAPDNASNKNIIWRSENPDVASVNSTGMVTALNVGETFITATCINETADSVFDVCKVVVKSNSVEATSVTLNHSRLSLYCNESFQLSATVLPEETTNKTITWSSDDTSIATVDENGLVTATGRGYTFINARCGFVTNFCLLNVVESPFVCVDNILSDDSNDYIIYDYSGAVIMKVSDRAKVKNLNPGFYIVRHGDEVRKVVIK